MACKPEIIAEGRDAYIIRCTNCQQISLCYKNLIAGFNPENFSVFSHAFSQINFEESAIDFPDGKSYIMVNTCHQDIQMRFNKEEFEEVKGLVQQAIIMLDTLSILNQPRV